MAPTPPPFEINLKVFTKDCVDLDAEVLDELCFFLEKLQANPYSPDILDNCQRHGSKYAIEFFQGYAVYWTLREPTPGEVISIEILRVARKADI